MGLFSKSSRKNRRLKVLVYGDTGSGKTIFGLTFPKPAVIDMESGTIHYEDREVVKNIGQKTDFLVYRTGSALMTIKAVDELVSEHSKWVREGRKGDAPFETVIIDSGTIFWEQLQTAYMEHKGNTGAFGGDMQLRDWPKVKRPIKDLLTDLMNLPCNFVLTAHEGNVYEQSGKELKKVGVKPKIEGGTPYVADVVLRMLPQDDGGGTNAIIEKDRTNVFAVGERIKNVSYKMWEGYLEESAKVGQEVAGPDKADADQDKKMFSEEPASESGDGTFAERLVADDKYAPFFKEMDWAPAKQLAMAKRFTKKEDWEAFLRKTIKEFRDEKRGSN